MSATPGGRPRHREELIASARLHTHRDEDFAARLRSETEAYLATSGNASGSKGVGDATSSDKAKSHLLSHALLAGPLLSAAELEDKILTSDKRLAEAQEEAKRRQTSLIDSLQKLSRSLDGRRHNLAQLPDDIGSVEDMLLDLCSELGDKDGGASAQQASTTVSLQTLEAKHSLLTQLMAARDYLAVLARAEGLKLAAIRAEEEERDGMTHLSELASFSATVKAIGEGNKAHSFVQAQRGETITKLAKIRESRLAKALEEAGWPPQPAELQMATSTQGNTDPVSTSRSPYDMFWTDKTIQKHWADLMLLQRRGEKLGVLHPSSARLDLATKGPTASPGSAEYQPLLAVQVLMKPLLLRFYYHFDSERSTNRLDKPEWYLGHMLSILRSSAALFEPKSGEVARLSANIQRKSGDMRYDLYAELIHAVLRPLVLKIESSVPLLLQNSQLLSHTIMQVVQFDEELRSTLVPVSPRLLPVHLADALLTKEMVFEAWVQSERVFASSRLQEELEGGSAWLVGDEEGVEDEAAAGSWESMRQDADALSNTFDPNDGPKLKTTRSARAVVSLIDGLTSRYRALHVPSHQLPFLLIQLSILQQYAQRLERSLEAFESISSAFSRHIPGGISVTGAGTDSSAAASSETDMVRGLRGLGRLLKACLSALYIRQHLDSLSATSFFLILGSSLGASSDSAPGPNKLLADFRKWEGDAEETELDQASLGELVRRGWRSGGRFASSIRPLGGASSSSARSSPVIGGPLTQQEEIIPQDTEKSVDVFQKPRERFEALVARALRGMEMLITSEVLEGLRTYAQRDWSDEIDDEIVDEDASRSVDGGLGDTTLVGGDLPTTSLLPCLSVLSTHLTHLLPSLPRPEAHRVYRNVAQNLSNAIVERVIMAGGAHRFSEAGADRFARDVRQGWLATVGDASALSAAGRRPQAPWRFLIDAASLISLPMVTDKTDPEGISNENESSTRNIALLDACSVAFEQEGQDWPQMQERLGVDDRMALRVAREILRRRVECPW